MSKAAWNWLDVVNGLLFTGWGKQDTIIRDSCGSLFLLFSQAVSYKKILNF